jgi:cyclopropane fatty-acyl-phospholipid synthase-like methyltransferase
MHRFAVLSAVLFLHGVSNGAQDRSRNIWDAQYKTRSALAMAQQFESPSRPAFRYRAAIAGLLQLEPGMTAADIGAGSGYLARLMASRVGPSGRVFATELDPKMVDYINQQARAEQLGNLRAVQGQVASTGLDAASVDRVAMIDTFSFFDRPQEMLRSIHATLKPGGLMLIVDSPREGQGATATGIDAEDVVTLATASGFARMDESSVVPGQYALRFRKP